MQVQTTGLTPHKRRTAHPRFDMGWTFCSQWQCAKDVREALNFERRNSRSKLIDQKATSIGRHLWSLYETPEGQRIITLDLIEGSGGEWGYKDMDESMGPFYYDCPVSMLDAATTPVNATAANWRLEVRNQAARKARKFKAGDKVRLYGKVFTCRDATTVQAEDGKLYRLKRTQVAECELIA